MKHGMLLLLGVLLSAAAQLLIKYGVSGVDTHGGALLRVIMRWPVILGAVLYIAAFAVYIYILAIMDISVASPIMIGGVTLLVLLGAYYFGEPLGILRLTGALMVIVGISMITLSVK